MDEEIIDAIADTLAEQLRKAENVTHIFIKEIASLAVLDDIIAMAVVVNTYQPTYDLRYFYRRTGFPEPYPDHPMNGEES